MQIFSFNCLHLHLGVLKPQKKILSIIVVCNYLSLFKFFIFIRILPFNSYVYFNLLFNLLFSFDVTFVLNVNSHH